MTATLNDLDAAVVAFADAKITTTNVLTNLIKLYNAGIPVNSANLTTLVEHFNEMTVASNNVRALIAEIAAAAPMGLTVSLSSVDPELTVT